MIDITWFPYDLQQCEMKFGAWLYIGYYVDLKQLPQSSFFHLENDNIFESEIHLSSILYHHFTDQVINGIDKYDQEVETMKIGMDLSFFYQ